MSLQAKHDELLNRIEDHELLSLRWGDVSGSLSRETVVELAEAVAPGQGEDLIEDLLDAALLHTVYEIGSSERYRSRFAELVRLLARLRQTFPGEAWQGSPPLVSDYRLDLRKRRYPRRDIDSDAALGEIEGMSALQQRVWRALAPTTISAFQLRAAKTLFEPAEQDVGVIVGAGTGSGKTLAFYLPAFVRLAELIQPRDHWTKVVAIYPRNELLKDQLSEAYRKARTVSEILTAAGRRPMRVAPYYGDTPRDASERAINDAWKSRRNGYLCPFMRCECGSDLLWSKADISAGVERLVCANSCGYVTDPDILVLTRRRQTREPPDILFTTTEMLNRSLSDQRLKSLFGVRCAQFRRPEFLLLDEAHTYTGVAGAQAALTLRRWRHLCGGPVAWVGLSATLDQARGFFSDLTGVYPAAVSEVVPSEDEFEEEGREYQIALRGDAAARTSILSTSIQAAMLLARFLDPVGGRSQGRFGRRLFAFTDDLDVNHRLFDDLRDAEAYTKFGRPDPRREPLANLRSLQGQGPSETDAERRVRDNDGQRWRAVETIGRALADRLTVARTTSRDPGVDGGADVVVATSALEVGFNDPNVGAVLQHKAPRNAAAFLQRKGRAGRQRSMRPLMVTVLSDYNRDRLFFQSAEHLFDPGLPAQSLPVRNEYVLRMQAAFAVLDWLSDQPRNSPAGSVWKTVAAPSSPDWDDRAWRGHLQQLLSDVLRDDSQQRQALRRHLRGALRIDEMTVDRLLWEAPRSILLEVVPTLLRRLFRDWKLAWPSPSQTDDRWVRDHPLPDFAPRALFSDLNLPELEILVASHLSGAPDTPEALPLQQGLSQLAPGRVTRRFGDEFGGLAHWYPVPPGVASWRLPVANYTRGSELLGQRQGEAEHGWMAMPVYRPWSVRIEVAHEQVVGVTSNSALTWASAFESKGRPVNIAAPPRTAWRELVEGVEVFLHQFRAAVVVDRFAPGARAEIRRRGGVTQVVDIVFEDTTGGPAAIGFQLETDGLALKLRLPTPTALGTAALAEPISRGLTAGLHRRLVGGDPGLSRELNQFIRAWLRQVHLLCCAKHALERGIDFEDAVRAVHAAGVLAPFGDVMDVLLGVQRLSPDHDDDDDSDDHTAATGSQGAAPNGGSPRRDRLERLKSALRDELAKPDVLERLKENLLEALDPAATCRGLYVRKALEGTLAEGLMAAAVAATPRHAAAEAMVVDVATDPQDPASVTLWLTETTLGGAGVLQALADRFAETPRILFRGIEAALEPSDLEVAASALSRVYALANHDSEVADAIAQVRANLDHAPRAAARARLLAVLEARGIETSRAFIVSLSARMLAPGLGVLHDDLVRCLLSFWQRAEDLLGLEIDLREIVVLAAGDAMANDIAIRAGVFTSSAPSAFRAQVFAGMLWPRAPAVHRESLSSWNPYRKAIPCEPAMVRALLFDGARAAVRLEQADWLDQFSTLLAHDGAATLSSGLTDQHHLGEAIVRLQAEPIHVGALSLYPALERVAKDEDRIWATFVLREQV